MPSPSAAQVAGNVMSPDLLDGLMRDCAGRMSTTAPGGELVGAAEKGDHHSQRIVEHFAVVDAMLEAASKEVLALTDMKPWLLKGPELRGHRAESMRPLSEEKANGFRKEIENLKAQRDALYKPVWKLAEGVMDAAAKGKDHANWDSHHPNGGPLRKKVIRPANELTKGMAQLAKGLREARFPDVAKGAAGQHLYDLVVEHVTIPGFAEKKGCKPEDVWGQYLDPNRYDSNRIGCADVGKKHLSTSFNEMSFMAVHVESALRLYKEPALDTLQPPADQRAPAPIDAEPRDINVTPRPAEGAPEANSGVDRAGAGSVNVNISFKDNLFYIGGDKNTVSNDASTSSDGAERQRPAAASAGSATDLFKSMSAVRSEPKPDERPSETAFDYRSGDGVYTFTFTPSPRPMGEPVGTAQPAGSARVESDPERVEATSDEAGGHEEFVTLPDRQTSPQPGIALGLQAPAGAAPQLQGQVSPVPDTSEGLPYQSQEPSDKRVASWSDSQARARRAARGDSDESPKSVGPASPHQLPSRPIGDDMAQEWPRRERRVSADSPAEMTDPAGMPTMHENSRDMNPKASLATVVRDGPRDSTQQFGLSSEDAEPQRETASPVRSWSAASSSKDSLDGWPASANSIDSGMRPTTPPGLARLAEPKNQPDPGWTGGRPDRGGVVERIRKSHPLQ
ncbi:hypothetical protein [Achromobacter xylosoxidans]|uniref:hypothetical protein n=1 Tax=Alcaligenes xylosoxydans xylosoxydans TaxID=85698 RepID=UPI00192C1495|nr:hypothetical protein [Achromobacter xylosoxidans]